MPRNQTASPFSGCVAKWSDFELSDWLVSMEELVQPVKWAWLELSHNKERECISESIVEKEMVGLFVQVALYDI